MPLHPQVRTIMDQMTAAGPPLHHLSPAEARKAVLAMRATQGEPERLAVGCESAGANLAAVAAMMAQERGAPTLVHQLLAYPVLNYAFDTPSYRENGNGYFLTKDMMAWFWRQYLRDETDGENPSASPLRSQYLRGVAPATILAAEFDPLRDAAEAYAARFRTAGVPA